MVSSTTRKPRKRVRDDGADMPRYHEAVDDETGEVYRVETTRQAKRRHQRTGGVQKPTIGQINAADIWNKQEEKIKKDREREERKRRNRSRQEAKEARLKELQEERLREGKITIEETWGRVNASQVRLHKFFGAPKGGDQSKVSKIATDEKENAPANEQRRTSIQTDLNLDQSGLITEEDLESIFSDSDISPAIDRKQLRAGPSSSTKSTALLNERSISPSQSPVIQRKRKSSQASQNLMPPPKRPRHISSETVPENATVGEDLLCGRQLPPFKHRSPLKEMSHTEIKARKSEHIDASQRSQERRASPLISTQIVRDTLSGLCSQDLEDDFEDDSNSNGKENVAPVEMTSVALQDHDTAVSNALDDLTHAGDGVSCSPEGQVPSKHTSTIDENMFEDLDHDEFDDEGIDDESLLSLAATQQLKKELFASSKQHKPARKSSTPSLSTSLASSPQVCPRQDNSNPQVNRLGDSFAMDGLDDSDLLEGLAAYESNTNGPESSDFLLYEDIFDTLEVEDLNATTRKPRRVLPWIKNPLSFSLHDGDEVDALTPSPQSPIANE